MEKYNVRESVYNYTVSRLLFLDTILREEWPRYIEKILGLCVAKCVSEKQNGNVRRVIKKIQV